MYVLDMLVMDLSPNYFTQNHYFCFYFLTLAFYFVHSLGNTALKLLSTVNEVLPACFIQASLTGLVKRTGHQRQVGESLRVLQSVGRPSPGHCHPARAQQEVGAAKGALSKALLLIQQSRCLFSFKGATGYNRTSHFMPHVT